MISYNLYWLTVIAGFLFLGWKEKKHNANRHDEEVHSESSSGNEELAGKKTSNDGVMIGTAVREVQ